MAKFGVWKPPEMSPIQYLVMKLKKNENIVGCPWRRMSHNCYKQRLRKWKTGCCPPLRNPCLNCHKNGGSPKHMPTSCEISKATCVSWYCCARIETSRQCEKIKLSSRGVCRHTVMLMPTTSNTCCEVTILPIHQCISVANFLLDFDH